jgi:hypothetical protein
MRFTSNMKNYMGRDVNRRQIRTDGDYYTHSNKEINRKSKTNPHQSHISNIFSHNNTHNRGLIHTDVPYYTIKDSPNNPENGLRYLNKSLPKSSLSNKIISRNSKINNSLTKSKKWKDVIKYL